MTYRKKHAVDEHGDPVETARFPKTDADKLLRFNVTGQRIADHCNQARQFFPWDNEIHRSTWYRALNGDPVWDEVVGELEGLYAKQQRNPRKYLPGPPDVDNLFDWMTQVAGAKWWLGALSLDVKPNTMNAWMSRGGAKQEMLDTIRERVLDWWRKVDQACTQADMVRAYHAMEKIRFEEDGRPRPVSFESYFYTYVHEDGHSVDEARAHYVEMADLGENHHLQLLDLSDPGPVAVEGYRSPYDTEESFARRFDELWARGLDGAMPREMPEGTDLSDTVSEQQWPDRRSENSPYDVNHGLYKKWYRTITSWGWCREERRKVPVSSEIVAVSDDGQTWVEPTERQKQGWDRDGIGWSKWLNETGELPDNLYTREVKEAEDAMLKARAKARQKVEMDTPEWSAYQRARAEYERAVEDY